MSLPVWIAVGLLGGVGAVGRFTLDAIVSGRLGAGFPFGTLAINVSGALALGLLSGLAVGATLLVIVGGALLGAYTTFSTWMFETHRLAEDGKLGLATVNVIVSLAVGFGAALVGHAIGARL